MLSFIVLAISSGVLYFIPDRKVASWDNWTFLYLDKQQWDNLHINLGILFLVLIVWHIYFNWKPLTSYLKVKKELKIFTKEFNVSLLLVALFSAGTISMTLPFSFLVNIGNGVKAMNAKDDANPPFGYAEYATLEDFCTLTALDTETSIKRLQAKDIMISSSKETLKAIAVANNISPKEIYLTIKSPSTKAPLPSDIPIGIAQKSLKRLAMEYKMDTARFIKHLNYYGITASKETNFKKIAMQNDLHPAALYNILLASQKSKLMVIPKSLSPYPKH